MIDGTDRYEGDPLGSCLAIMASTRFSRIRCERGTRVATLFYSPIESVKRAGVEPRAYLGEAARRAIRSPGAVTLARDLK